MNRETFSNGLVSAIGKGIGFTVAAGAALLVATELPGLRRYLRILSFAKRAKSSRSTVVPNGEDATYAQAPRRSDAHDPDKGHGRRHGAEPSRSSAVNRA